MLGEEALGRLLWRVKLDFLQPFDAAARLKETVV